MMSKDELLAYADVKVREAGLGKQSDLSVFFEILENRITSTEQVDEHFNG